MPRLRSLVMFLMCATFASAADWPQWLGPNRDGVSTEKISPWKKAPKRLWSVPVGEGHSSPVVADGKVFLHYKVKGKTEEEIAAFDALKGKKLWSESYETVKFESIFGHGPRATPTVAGGKVYSYGVTGVLSCWDAKTGKKIWQVDTLKKFKAPNLYFGLSCSPLIEGDKVVVSVGKGTSVVAFGKNKGAVVWKSLDDPASYSSPMAFGKGKNRQIVFLTQQGVVSLSPGKGEVFWKYQLIDDLAESSITPVRVGDWLFASSVTFGGVGLNLSTKNGKPAAKEGWRKKILSCYFSTPVPAGEHLYMVTGSIVPFQEATLRCVEIKTGKELWNKPKIGKYHASLLRTGNDKFLLLDDGGSLALLEPNPKGYKELSRSKICGPTWAHPALANGLLYIRDQKELICLQLQ